jgi:alkyl hydroperoxide reductase subunit AhpC
VLGVGERFPLFSLMANVSADERRAFQTMSDQDFPGKWKLYFFWPKDFTPLSLAEIVDFGALEAEFRERNTQLLGCSVESELAHLAWRNEGEDLRELRLPMLSDIGRDLMRTTRHSRRERWCCAARHLYRRSPKGNPLRVCNRAERQSRSWRGAAGAV